MTKNECLSMLILLKVRVRDNYINHYGGRSGRCSNKTCSQNDIKHQARIIAYLSTSFQERRVLAFEAGSSITKSKVEGISEAWRWIDNKIIKKLQIYYLLNVMWEIGLFAENVLEDEIKESTYKST